jgi:hypothetical protein
VKPSLLAEVNYCSRTKDALLRHTSLKEIGEDNAELMKPLAHP